MALTETQREIANAINTLTPGWSPVATVSDIAEETNLSEQAVRNHIDTVVQTVTRIDSRKVGQTTVYYYKRNLLGEIEDENTVGVHNLADVRGNATYSELRDVGKDSHSWEARWYDHNANEIDGYRPTTEEIGRTLDRPYLPPTKLWDPDELEFENETEEDEV